MLKNTLSTWNKNRLRFILALFFLALAIPTAVLIKQAYSQLKWEAFHHYRLQAEELAARIDQNYKEIIEAESARAFTDYSFLNIAGNTKSKFLQRSPLSAFPVNSKFPGVIGYFQIDNYGEFTTPLLPTAAAEKFPDQNYSITKDEKVKREIVHNQIHQILSQNKLINKPVVKITKKETTSTLAEEVNEIRLGNTGKIDKTGKTGKFTLRDDVVADQSIPSEPESAPAPASIASPSISSPSISLQTSEAEIISSQSAFDKLQAPQDYRAAEKYKGRVEDLKLKKQYQKKSLKQKKKEISGVKANRQKITRRKESNVLPEFSSSLRNDKNRPEKKDTTLRVNMFESEIDEFEFSLLESGHFVLYRKVWRNGVRFIQGLLINPDLFINNIIAKSFYNTNVSNASNLTIAYQGNILSTLNRNNSRSSYASSMSSQGNGELEGTLLLQNKLSATLEQIELIFSVNNLPAGPGGSIITWLSFILLIILCGGFFTLYILGTKQITLARQQQDFVSAVSHELKTPLTSIRMYGEMLREGWTTEEKRTQYYDYIYDESERLTRLINNVLQLARMTRNELPVDLKPYKIAELLDNTYSKINSQVERSEFKLNLECDETIKEKEILADADYFIQIIINLVDNAIKFSAKAEIKQIDIHCKTLRNNKVQFTIRDYGPGVNKDQLRKIFNLFYRSENELTRETVGTGIGLSLVNQLANSMRGKIDVISKDPGLEFQLTFTAI